MLDTLTPLAGGILISIVFHDELMAVREWLGQHIGTLIIFLIFGRSS